jgi:hypothetical protein
MKAIPRIAVVAGLLGSAVRAWPLGDVQVSVTDGKLSVLGDDSPNEIEISADADTGAFVVTGVEGTAVNGGVSAAVTGVRKIRIDMKAGQDSVQLLEVEVEDRLFVKLGADRDTFALKGGRVRGRAEVRGGRKDGDELTVHGDARIGGRLVLTTGGRRDTITVSNVSIGGGLDITSGAGNDYILVEHTTVDSGAETDVEAGDGNDRLELVEVDFEDDLEVDLDDGDDDLRVEDCDFDGEIDADGGDGDDELDLSGENSFDLGEKRRVVNFEDFD